MVVTRCHPAYPSLYGVFTIMNKRFLLTALCALTLVACGKKEETPPASAAAAPANTEEKVLNIYNWPDYITQDMVANFEKESGIKVNYQTFENNEALQAKLIAGNSGYDLVVPGAVFAKSQISRITSGQSNPIGTSFLLLLSSAT